MFFYSVYVGMQYDEISLTFTSVSVSLCCVSEFVVVPYVDGVTVMPVLLFVLHVCLLRECDCVRLTGNAGVGGWMRYGECGACGWYTWFRDGV